MKILHSWLRRYISFKLSPEALTERLTMLGLEFESVERPGERYRGFVVGKVMACERHPSADRLSVCTVNVGRDTVQIVCGAPNVAAGQKVVVGTVGATVPRSGKDGAPMLLSAVTIRGVESRGMICSEYELDLGKDADGILVLDDDATVGQRLVDYLGLDDVVYDVEITPNRPDWLSHIGVAREIAVLTGSRATLPRAAVREGRESIRKHLSISVQSPAQCPRFAARMVRGVRVAPSPRWLQNALRNVGLRPVNNVVDVTNFVMLETGHPLHAFDYALLRGKRIVVRQVSAGTGFTTLDGKTHSMPEGAVMVCDGEREVSIAGIMGGMNSEIGDGTADVVLEAAYWNPSSIRRTAKTLGLSTDASQRFERGADPNGVRYALDRAASLVHAVAGGTVLKGVIDVYPKKIRPTTVTLRTARVNAVLGTGLAARDVARILRVLGIRTRQGASGVFRCEIPTFRVDLTREIDLIEEVARVHGYDNIEERARASVDLAHPFAKGSTADRVRSAAVGAGFREAICNPMVNERRAFLGHSQPARVLNPLSQDMAFLRTSLIPGLLDVVVRNQGFGGTSLRMFEIGHVFAAAQAGRATTVAGYEERERLALVLSGQASPRQWGVPSRSVDLFDMKGAMEEILKSSSLDKWSFLSYSTSDGLIEDPLAIDIEGTTAGLFGRLKSGLRDEWDVKEEIFVAEIDLDVFGKTRERRYAPLPKFPRVRRDVAFVVSTEVRAASMIETMREAAGEILQSAEVFDVFEGESVGRERRSLAFSLELLSKERTLTEADIDAVVRRVVSAVERQHNAVLRSAS